MTTPNFCTFDGGLDEDGNTVPPYRPGPDDFGGLELEDDVANPPEEGEMPVAGGWNQFGKQAVAHGRVATPAKLSVTFVAGAPVVVLAGAMNGSLTSADFVPTDHATGDVTITVTADKMPARRGNPRGLTIVASSAPAGVRWGQVSVVSAVAIRVKLYEGTTLTDLDFEIDWE